MLLPPIVGSHIADLPLPMKSYDLTQHVAGVLNTDLFNTGAVSALGNLTKTLDSAIFNTGAVSALGNLTKTLDSAMFNTGAVSALESLTKTFDSAMKSYDLTKYVTNVVNTDLFGMEGIANKVDLALKTYEPLMNSVASSINMAALLNEVTKNFSFRDFDSLTDLSALSRSLVDDSFVADSMIDIDLESFGERLAGLEPHPIPEEEGSENYSVAGVAEFAIYCLALLLFVHFVLPGIALICIATAKEFADHVNDISKMPLVNEAMFTYATVSVVVDTTKTVKKLSKRRTRNGKPDKESDAS
jgi:hypothetical protein